MKNASSTFPAPRESGHIVIIWCWKREMLGKVPEQSFCLSTASQLCHPAVWFEQAQLEWVAAQGPMQFSSNVCVPLANFKWGAAASKLAGMFYSLLTMPDSADITVCTQWHLWSILFLQAFPNAPSGMHKNCSHLRHQGSGVVCPLPQLAPCTATSPSAWALWGSDHVCPHRGFYDWFEALAVHLLSDLVFLHLRS